MPEQFYIKLHSLRTDVDEQVYRPIHCMGSIITQ